LNGGKALVAGDHAALDRRGDQFVEPFRHSKLDEPLNVMLRTFDNVSSQRLLKRGFGNFVFHAFDN
jgi:hypothetical protein